MIDTKTYSITTPTCKKPGSLTITKVERGRVHYILRGPKEPEKSVLQTAGHIPEGSWERFLTDVKVDRPAAPVVPVQAVPVPVVPVPVVPVPVVPVQAVPAAPPAPVPKTGSWRDRRRTLTPATEVAK